MAGDIFVPQSSAAEARVGPLQTITYTTGDLDTLHPILCEGFLLQCTDTTDAGIWSAPAGLEPLGVPANTPWRAALYQAQGSAANVAIRVIEVPTSTPAIRPVVDGSILGGLSIGFPMADMSACATRLSALGIESSIGVKEMEFTGPTGETYVSAEVHFIGPEQVFLLGVRRPDGFVPVGPLNSKTGIGGPAYSARCVNNPEAVITFLQTVLGYEIRRDATFEVGEQSGLRLQPGSPERFIQAFAPGSATGYLVLLDHSPGFKPSPAPTLTAPNRGMVGWSFEANDLAALATQAKAAGAMRINHQRGWRSPLLPDSETLVIQDPGGFVLEFCAR